MSNCFGSNSLPKCHVKSGFGEVWQENTIFFFILHLSLLSLVDDSGCAEGTSSPRCGTQHAPRSPPCPWTLWGAGASKGRSSFFFSHIQRTDWPEGGSLNVNETKQQPYSVNCFHGTSNCQCCFPRFWLACTTCLDWPSWGDACSLRDARWWCRWRPLKSSKLDLHIGTLCLWNKVN